MMPVWQVVLILNLVFAVGLGVLYTGSLGRGTDCN